MAKETIGPLTKAEIEFAIHRLSRVTESVGMLETWLKANPECKELWVWRAFSLQDGLRRLESVVPEISRAIHAYTIGNPQGPNSSKARNKKVHHGQIVSVEEATSDPRLGEIVKPTKVVRVKKKRPKK